MSLPAPGISLINSTPPRRLIVLGSTGSIGVNTLQVAGHLSKTGLLPIDVAGLAAGKNSTLLIKQAQQFNVRFLAVADDAAAAAVRQALPKATVFSGPSAACQLVEALDATDLTAAIVGSAGLEATLAGIRKGMRIGLANKETLVAAGALVKPLCRKHHAPLLPVDSEHSAIFQCLTGREGQGIRAKGQAEEEKKNAADLVDTSAVKRIVLTASGGPFRTTPKERMQQATVAEALNHPTWKMGAKITIDSATLMNKALEIIEAHWLFDLPSQKIAALIHPQSVIHSFVEFVDHSVLAQLGPPDMKTPIQYALTWPQRLPGCSLPMDWTKLSKLDFAQPDPEKFPALKLAYEVIDAGGTAGTIFNAANEAAVAAFLAEKIRFGRIVELVAQTLAAIPVQPVDGLDIVQQVDQQAREMVAQLIG